MKKSNWLKILACTLWTSCGQDYNSHSGDESLGASPASSGVGCEEPADARRCAAIKVLQTNCFRCHSAWSEYTTDIQWSASGYVVQANASASLVISRLINSGSNMPQGGSALADDDYQALVDWIQQMPTAEAGQ